MLLSHNLEKFRITKSEVVDSNPTQRRRNLSRVLWFYMLLIRIFPKIFLSTLKTSKFLRYVNVLLRESKFVLKRAGAITQPTHISLR